MRPRTAMLFPGQGAYVPGIFSDLATTYGVIGTVLEAVDQVAAEHARSPISPLLLDKNATGIDELVRSDPARSHLAIYATSLAMYHVLADACDVRADVVAGHSFGEIAALAAAGAFDVYSGARIVAARDVALERCAPRGGMVSLRASGTRTAHVVAAAGVWHVSVAARNSSRQTVVSGPDDELALVEAVAAAADVPTRRLRAPYPFHNRLLHPVADMFADLISRVPVTVPRTTVYSPVLGRYVTDDDLGRLIVSQLTRPVEFDAAVRALLDDGVETYVEVGARSILVDLVTDNVAHVTTCAPLRTRCAPDEFSARISVISGRGALPTVPAPRQQPVSPPQRPEPEKPPAEPLVEMLAREYASGLDYPLDVLTADADLEADLGVDSIKQTEMFNRVSERLGLRKPEGLRVTSLRTLADVAALLSELGAENQLGTPL